MPKLRFNQTDGTRFPNWDKSTFEDTFQALNNNTFSRDCLTNVGNVKNIHYGDILVQYGEICDIQRDIIPFVKDGYETKKYDKLANGDIIIADTAEDETVGKVIEIFSLTSETVISGLHTMAYRPTNSFCPRYLGYYMNSPAYHNQLLPLMQGIKVTSVSRKNIAGTSIAYPTDKKEQQRIAEFLSAFDEKISIQSLKVSTLEEKKKGIVQALFDKTLCFGKEDGSEFPKWEKVQLSELLEEYKEKCEKNGTYEHVSLTKEGVVPKSERYERDFLVTSDDKEYRVTHVDDICYNPANLKFGVICRNKYKDAIFSPIYVTFKVKEKATPIFMEYLLVRNDFINYALKYQEGTVYERMAVSPEDFLSIEVEIPCIDEQNKISDFLSLLDEQITIEKEKLEIMKLQKKGLLQQMFE